MGPVVGLILLIGIVALASLGLFYVNVDTLASMNQQAQNDRIEGSFVELSQAAPTTSVYQGQRRSIDLVAGEGGAVYKAESGTIEVDYDDIDGALAEPITFGTVEYVVEEFSRRTRSSAR